MRLTWRLRNQVPTIAKLLIASIVSVALALSNACRSPDSTWRANSGANSSSSSQTSVKVRPLTNRKFERTPGRLARGRYLVNGVGECFAPYEFYR
jgi:hypothetical protein